MNTEITIQVPIEIASHLAVSDEDLSRTALEALAIEGYRDGRLSVGQVAEMLQLSVLQTEEFLSSKEIPLNYSLTDFEDDLVVVDELARK